MGANVRIKGMNARQDYRNGTVTVIKLFRFGEILRLKKRDSGREKIGGPTLAAEPISDVVAQNGSSRKPKDQNPNVKDSLEGEQARRQK